MNLWSSRINFQVVVAFGRVSSILEGGGIYVHSVEISDTSGK